MVLSILGSLVTILAVALPEIFKWMERTGALRKAADVALQHVSLSALRTIRDRVRQSQGQTPLP